MMELKSYQIVFYEKPDEWGVDMSVMISASR